MDPNFHVTIIGAGLGGLCLAQALKRRGIRFDVHERDNALDERAQGYRIRIDAAGQRALAGAWTPSMNEVFRGTASLATSAARFVDTRLAPIGAQAPDSWNDEGPADLGIHRQTLRELLMTGIEDHVHFGHAFGRYESIDGDRLRVSFDGIAAIDTDLLVGADGVNSRVRQQLVPTATPLATTGICIYGRAMLTHREALHDGTHVVFADGCAAILEEMRFGDIASIAERQGCTLSRVDDYLYWAIVGTRWRLGLPDDLSVDARPLLARVTQAWHPTLRQVFCDSQAGDIAMMPIRVGRPDIAWPCGRVTLLGDAIHAMSPAGGRGANTALEDAVALADGLSAMSGRGELSDALARYEAGMRVRGGEAIAVSQAGMERLVGVV